MRSTALVCSLTTFAVFAAGLLALRPSPGRPITLLHALRAAFVGGVVALALVVACLASRRFFLGVNIAYCATMIAAPLAGLALVLFSRVRAVTRSALACAALALVLAPVGAWATFVEPYRLTTERVDVTLAPPRALARPLTIAVLADLQATGVTDHERDAVRRALEARPDLILLPGDLVQVGEHELGEIEVELKSLLSLLEAPLGAWFVQGNCESKEQARRLLAGTPVRFLDDEVVLLERDRLRVRLCGVDLGFESDAARSALHEIENASGDDDVRIVLAHRPDVVAALAPRTRVDLVVAGHTHGGQVRVPFFGPPITLSDVPRAIAAGGLHELDRDGGRRIYVSRGIGWEHGHAPRVRFLCPPEVSMITLRTR